MHSQHSAHPTLPQPRFFPQEEEKYEGKPIKDLTYEEYQDYLLEQQMKKEEFMVKQAELKRQIQQRGW